jgi:hypothetical protein
LIAGSNGTAEQASEKCNKTRESFLQGLKPGESAQLMSALKRRPPKETKAPTPEEVKAPTSAERDSFRRL